MKPLCETSAVGGSFAGQSVGETLPRPRGGCSCFVLGLGFGCSCRCPRTRPSASSSSEPNLRRGSARHHRLSAPASAPLQSLHTGELSQLPCLRGSGMSPLLRNGARCDPAATGFPMCAGTCCSRCLVGDAPSTLPRARTACTLPLMLLGCTTGATSISPSSWAGGASIPPSSKAKRHHGSQGCELWGAFCALQAKSSQKTISAEG